MRLVLFCATVTSASAVASRTEREACPFWKAVGVISDHIELACGGERSIKMDPAGRESVALACCPEPYGKCKTSERVLGCDDIIAPILSRRNATASKEAWVKALQKARGALVVADDRCSSLAPEEPYATCKGENIAGRDDIYCEMMLFQTEQLGDGDPSEYRQLNCPYPGKRVKDAGQKKGGKMQRKLDRSEVPDIWYPKKKKKADADL